MRRCIVVAEIRHLVFPRSLCALVAFCFVTENDERETDGDEEKRQELAVSQKTKRESKRRIAFRFAELFPNDSHDCIEDEKRAGQYAARLARFGSQKPDGAKYYDAFEQRFIKL